MELQSVKYILGYSALINLGILIFWFAMVVFAKDWIYSLHGKIFDVKKEEIGKIHLHLIGLYKLIVYVFFVIPFLVIHYIL